MQSGKIKHWNEEKGYGFIDVDNQGEDVFFHISKVRLSQPITIGQQVYFNSERNDKNQLRAVEVTATALSLQEDLASVTTPRTTLDTGLNAGEPTHPNRHNSHNYKNNRRANSSKKSPLSTLFSFIAIIAVAFYFFGDLQSSFFDDELQTSTVLQDSISATEAASTKSITGDAQIDHTIALIQQGGPYPYPHKDGTTFYNREGRLPAQSSGYYREYTVPTPGVSHRGARRIVTGGHPPTVYYLTVDHYESFSQLQVK